MKSKILLFVLFTLIFPTQAFAHIEPIKRSALYKQSVSITGVSLVDDDNWFGPADVLFDFIVDAVSPKHDEQAGITSETIPVSSGQTVTFEPIEIYSHEMCHCDEEFDIDIAVFDYAPIQTFLVGLLEKSLDWLTTYLTSGTTGLIIHLVGDAFDLIVEELMNQGLSEEESQYQAYVNIIRNSDFLGAMREIQSTDCEPGEEDFTSDIFWEERYNGQVMYKIKKEELGEACPITEDEIGTVPGGEGVTVGDGTVVTTPDPQEDVSGEENTGIDEGSLVEEEEEKEGATSPAPPTEEEPASSPEETDITPSDNNTAEEEAAQNGQEKPQEKPQEPDANPDETSADVDSDVTVDVTEEKPTSDTSDTSDAGDTSDPSDGDTSDAPPSDG